MPNLRLEQLHVSQFLALISPDKVNAIAQSPPEPDFIILLNDRVIGLEHTELIRQKDALGIDIMAHSKIADRIMHEAERIFNIAQTITLMVHVDFRCTYGLAVTTPVWLGKKDIKPLSEFIANLVIQYLPIISLQSHGESIAFEQYDLETFEQILPDKIEHIRITNTCDYKTPCWSANQGGAVPGIFDSMEFKHRIEEKNSKPSLYKKIYTELWLLLVEDSMDLTSYFYFEQQTKPVIISPYNRIFILRRSENIIIELEVIKPTG